MDFDNNSYNSYLYNTNTSSTQNTIISSLFNLSSFALVVIILFFSYFGYNIFDYLAIITQKITNFISPLILKLTGATIEVADQTIDVSAEGAKYVVEKSASTINKGLTAVQNIEIKPEISNTKYEEQPYKEIKHDIMQQSNFNKSLNDNPNNYTNERNLNNDYFAHEAHSSVVYSGSSGWCYVGDDRGFRTCAEIGAGDKCMSGDIFPTQEICVNPNLRK